MKSRSLLLVVAFCSQAAIAQSLPPGHPPMDAKKQEKPVASAQLPHKGKVVSLIEIPQYTYLEVSENNKTVWLAASTVAVKKGDVIRFDDGMAMTNFHSKTLNRTFPSIVFVNTVVVSKE